MSDEGLRVGSLFSGIQSAASTMGSRGLGFDTSSSLSRILGAAKSCERVGRGCPSTTTYEAFELFNWTHTKGRTNMLRSGGAGGVPTPPLVFSVGVSPAKTSASPETAPDSPGTAPASSTSSPGSLSLFDPDGYSSRTYPVSSLRTAVGTSEQCLERWPTSGTAWAGGFSTAVTSECRSDAEGCSSLERSLTEILEPPQNVPARYSLSARAAQGILRRAEKRGRTLPSHLSAALETVARTTTTDKQDG